jgi:RND superfamily putative drug exporter
MTDGGERSAGSTIDAPPQWTQSPEPPERSATSTVGAPPPVTPFYTPPQVTPFSKLGTPVERRPWWAPAGWLLVTLTSLVFYAILLALSPLLLSAIVGRRIWRRTLRYRRSPADLRIAVIGGGWSGLQCLQRFREIGVEQVDVFERYDDIGGTWSPHLRYHGLQIHGSMTVTSFDGFPYSEDPDVQGGKVMGEEVERYIHRFADARNLSSHCHLNSKVESLDYSSADGTGTLTVSDTRTGEARTTGPYDLVIWASMAASGRIPPLPGAEAFLGRQLHTVSYSDAELEDIVRNNRRVVLVGGGKAACDVALSLRRMGYDNFAWVMRKPYLFYKFEALLHDASPKNKLRGLTYLATVLFTGVSRRFGAILHWSSGHLHTLGRPHADFTRFHGGVLCATQRRELRDVPHMIGSPAGFEHDGIVLEDGAKLGADVVIWATGNSSGIDELRLTKDGEPFALDPDAKLYNHFVVPDLPVLASSTALWTTFGPMRATNAADLAVYHLAVRKQRSQRRMQRAARRQLSRNSLVHSFIWAHDACWLQRWVHFHIDLVRQGITPVEAFFKHALEVFVLSKETPLRFNLLPPGPATAPAPAAAWIPVAKANGAAHVAAMSAETRVPPGDMVVGAAAGPERRLQEGTGARPDGGRLVQPRSGQVIRVGPLGRLGRYTATHVRVVLLGWLVVALGLGFFAPKVEKALSGTGWEVTGSDSVQARDVIAERFKGLTSYGLTAVVHSSTQKAGDGEFEAVVARVERTLAADGAVESVVPPSPGVSISRDGHTALVQAGAARSSDDMVRAADDLKGRLAALSSGGVQVNLTGQSAKWSDFNAANKEAMLKSELISWPVTLGILLLAFGSLVAAGLPLMLTMVGLTAAAGMLYLGTLVFPISVWAMNFAMMFALALGVDYALFLVHRFRGAFFGEGLSAEDATAVTMDTAGKAVVFSGITVLISLSAVMLVPSPAFRSMSFGIMLAVIFVLAAALTLLPAVLARLGPKVNRLSLPWARPSEQGSQRLRRWGEQLWAEPIRHGVVALAILVGLALPVTQLTTAMPTIKVVPPGDSSYIGDRQVANAFGPGATGPLQIVAPATQRARVADALRRDPGVGAVTTEVSGAYALFTAVPKQDPSTPAVGQMIDRLRTKLPQDALLGSALVGGAVTENHDLAAALKAKTLPVIGVVVGLGFLLLLIALQAPLLAALGVLTNLLATAAAFGVAKRIFQDGELSSVLGFEPQGFLDAWGPVFFFALIFAVSMDYTVFLLSSAKAEWDRTGDPRQAMIGGLEQSGRVIFAAGAVMVAVFFTFALSGPIPPKEMGVVLGVAVLLDVALVRLLLLPVLLRLTGRAAWYLPRWARRVLPRITFGHG